MAKPDISRLNPCGPGTENLQVYYAMDEGEGIYTLKNKGGYGSDYDGVIDIPDGSGSADYMWYSNNEEGKYVDFQNDSNKIITIHKNTTGEDIEIERGTLMVRVAANQSISADNRSVFDSGTLVSTVGRVNIFYQPAIAEIRCLQRVPTGLSTIKFTEANIGNLTDFHTIIISWGTNQFNALVDNQTGSGPLNNDNISMLTIPGNSMQISLNRANINQSFAKYGVFAIWDRVLTSDEMNQLWNDPYILSRQQSLPFVATDSQLAAFVLDTSDNAYTSEIIDTGQAQTIMKGVTTLFSGSVASLNDITNISISFRASDKNLAISENDQEVMWTKFMSIPVINDDISIHSLGFFVKGRYQQVRFRTSNDNVIHSITVHSDSNRDKYAMASDAVWEPSTTITQTIDANIIMSDDPYIPAYKASLNFDVINQEKKNFFEHIDNDYSFAAANFQNSRRPGEWNLYDDNSIYLNEDIRPVSQGYMTTKRGNQYGESDLIDDAKEASPYVEYMILFNQTGTFNVWSRYYSEVNSGFYFQLDETEGLVGFPENEPTTVEISWAQVGHIDIRAAGLHTFRVYQGTIGIKYIDQILITQGDDPSDSEIQPVSPGPFNTYLLAKEHSNRNNEINLWKSSKELVASGQYNYEFNSIFYSRLDISYTQIGGNNNFYAAWSFKNADNDDSIGSPGFSYYWGL